jgi:uncharacterized membrane protein
MACSMTKFIGKYHASNWFCLICIFIAACAVMLTVPLVGIPAGKDLQQHLQFAAAFHEAILAGDFFPGWAAAENHGFGSVGIRFYPPVAYYLLALSQMLTNSWYDAFWINSLGWMFLGCTGVYFWAREWFSPLESTLAAMLYAIVPYHLFHIYQALLFAEFAASGLLPFCFLFISRVIRRGKPVDVLSFSISFSLLILTHIPLAIIGTLSLGVYAAGLMDWRNFKRSFISLLIAVGFSLLSTVFHWLKIVTEIGWVAHSSPDFISGAYNYEQYLFPLRYSMGKPVWHFDLPIFLALLMLLPLAVYLFLSFRKKAGDYGEQKILTALLATGAFSIFMMSAPSSFIWNSVPVLQKVQFPWRWLSVASLISVFAFVIGLAKLFNNYKKIRRPLSYAVLLVLCSIIIFDLTQSIIPSAPLSREAFAREIDGLQEKEGCHCWWTVWAEREAFKGPEKLSAESRIVSLNVWTSESREFQVEAGRPENIRVATFYYPHWQAEINGRSVPVEKAVDGSILIPVGAEKSLVKLYFREPVMLQLALAASLLTWLFFLTALFLIYQKNPKPDDLQ